MGRLASGLWVQAYMMRLQAEGIAAYVVARGDATAGAVAIRIATLDGRAALWERSVDLMTGARRWILAVEGPEPEIEAAAARARARDPDLWIIAVDDARGRHLLDAPGLD